MCQLYRFFDGASLFTVAKHKQDAGHECHPHEFTLPVSRAVLQTLHTIMKYAKKSSLSNALLVALFATAMFSLPVAVVAEPMSITPDVVWVNNTGNAAYTGNNAFWGVNGIGAVNYAYAIGKYEITNTQYAAFLNAVGQSNANGVYNANMGNSSSGTFGGIIQSGTSGAYSYSVASGFEAKPVNWVSWFSAARYVNWLENGKPVDATGTAVNNGTYTLGTATSGNITSWNAGSIWRLPSASEWMKAAFYNPDTPGYSTYGTGMNTIVSGTGGSASDGVVYQVSGSGPQAVGSFSNADNYYGLFDASGNVREWTGKVNPAASGTNLQEAYLANGSYAGGSDYAVSIDNGVYALGTSASAGIGFRVALVPEPSTIALAAMGVAGALGFKRLKRRPKQAADSLPC
jgi:sulfatase modifying factor 1